AATDLKVIIVEMTYGGTPERPKIVAQPVPQFTASDTAPKGFQAFLEDGEMNYRYRVSYTFGQSEMVGAQHSTYTMPWQTTMSRAIVVNPPEDVPMLHVFVDQGNIDWDLVDSVSTRVWYDDPGNHFHAERTFIVKSDFKRQDWV